MTDLIKTVAPKSDQLNFDDFVDGESKTITIAGVKIVETDQPIELHSVEFPGRPFKPGLTARRVLIGVWGKSAAGWEGRSLRLYGDPDVMFGKQKVGGIRISHASHIDGPKTLLLTVTRGRKAPHTVQPLVTVTDALGWIAAADSMGELQQAWKRIQQEGFAGDAGLVAAKDERKAWLSTPAAEVVPDDEA